MKENIELIDKNGLMEIKPLWEKLNAIHLKDSRNFKDHYCRFSFEERAEKFSAIDEENLHIQMVRGEGVPLGYCVSTVTGNSGELDSLYLEEELRGSGTGRLFVERAVQWMKGKGCDRIRVSVADGHESVLDFYEKQGFKPRLTVLELIG